MNDIWNLAFEAESLACRLERANHTADIAMELLWEEHPTSETDSVKIHCFISRFVLYHDALFLALNEVFETRKELEELADALYQAHRELKTASVTNG